MWKASAERQTEVARAGWYAFHHEFATARQIQRWIRSRWRHVEDLRRNDAATNIQCMARCHSARTLVRRRAFQWRVAEYMVREQREEVMELEDRRSAIVQREYEAWRHLNGIRRHLLLMRVRAMVRVPCPHVRQLYWPACHRGLSCCRYGRRGRCIGGRTTGSPRQLLLRP